jgi:hypothetical protein
MSQGYVNQIKEFMIHVKLSVQYRLGLVQGDSEQLT